ncbi:hypothetical protein [Moorena producens]|uniref:hypothetical protein n=1 Tax=Moorena producens TaxID=1155739 RepID=UPI001314831B|nr:hypothetical protein [Moorena producens]
MQSASGGNHGSHSWGRPRQSLMGETMAVAHGGDPQDRAASPRPRCLPKTALHPWLTLNSQANYTGYIFINVLLTRKTNDSLPTKKN